MCHPIEERNKDQPNGQFFVLFQFVIYHSLNMTIYSVNTTLLPPETAMRNIFVLKIVDRDSICCPASSPCYRQPGEDQHHCWLSPIST